MQKQSNFTYIIKQIVVLVASIMVALSGWAQTHMEHGDLLSWAEVLEPAHLLSLLGPVGGVFVAFFMRGNNKTH